MDYLAKVLILRLFKEMQVESVYAVTDTYELPKEGTPVIPISEPYSRVIGIFKKL